MLQSILYTSLIMIPIDLCTLQNQDGRPIHNKGHSETETHVYDVVTYLWSRLL